MDPKVRPAFYVIVFMLGLKHGLHIVVRVFQGPVLYGLLLGTMMGLSIIWIYRHVYAYADNRNVKSQRGGFGNTGKMLS